MKSAHTLSHAISLTERDISIILFVYLTNGSTIDRLTRRFWRNVVAPSACYERVAKLVAGGYLTAVRLPSTSGVGSGRLLVTLGPRSYPVLQKRVGLSRAEFHHLRHSYGLFFVEHGLATADLIIALQLACERSSSVTLVELVSERELRRVPMRVEDPEGSRTYCLIPDLVFRLRTGGVEQTFRAEIDLGTVAPKRLRERLRGYLLGVAVDSSPVLFVVPSLARQGAIVDWALAEATKLPGADPTLFWITTSKAISENTILVGPIWQIAGGPQAMALIPPGQFSPDSRLASAPATVSGLFELR